MNHIQRIRISKNKILLASESEIINKPDMEIWAISINSEIQMDFFFLTKELAEEYFKRKNIDLIKKIKRKP